MENYGKVLRNFVLFQNKLNKAANPDAIQYQNLDDYEEIVALKTLRAFSQFASSKGLLFSFGRVPLDEGTIKVLSTIVVMELFVDVYKVLNLREKLHIINAFDETLLKKMRETKDFDKIVSFLFDESNGLNILYALNFSELSVYDKVLQTKALDDDDIALLTEMFPLFQGEYDAYNVLVDENFMAREITKWPAQFNGDVDKAYADAAAFLDQYSIINASLYEKIADMTEFNHKKDTQAMLRKFMELR